MTGSEAVLFIAHLSDPHLMTGPLGVEPATRLHTALGRVLGLDPRPDCVVITGDLTEHADPQDYQTLRTVLAGFPLPLFLVAGNHDSSAELSKAFAGTPHLNGGVSTRYVVSCSEATLVVLDSSKPGTPAGELGTEQLAWLDEQLSGCRDRPALVCLHHPPIRVGIPFFDAMNLIDRKPLAEVISRHRHVVRVLAGHVHRPISAAFAGSTVTVAPSTYRQSELRLRDDPGMRSLDEPSGFLLHWIDGADCATHLVPVSFAGGPLGKF